MHIGKLDDSHHVRLSVQFEPAVEFRKSDNWTYQQARRARLFVQNKCDGIFLAVLVFLINS